MNSITANALNNFYNENNYYITIVIQKPLNYLHLDGLDRLT
jgi:hypothetical protein